MRSSLLFSFCMPLLCMPLVPAVSGNHHRSKVLILGAGMSGIKAAQALQSQGMRDFVILEGSNRIGGRLLSAKLKSGHTLNVGSQTVNQGGNWVHGLEGVDGENPIWTLAKTCHLSTKTSDFEDNVYFLEKSGTFVNETSSVLKEAWKSLEAAQDIMDAHKNYSASVSLRDALSDAGWHPTTAVDYAIEWYDYDFEFAVSPEVTSARFARPFSTFWGAEEEMVIDQRGYEHVIECLARQFLSENKTGHINDTRLHLNAIVSEIDYSASEPSVEVTTTDGRVYVSDFVIITFSNGVLQRGNVSFHPALPQQKVDAINKFPLAAYTSIFLKFERKFWSFDHQNVLFVSDKRGYYIHHINYAAFFDNDPNWYVLLITATEELSKQVESQSENATVSQIMEVLRKMYGSDIPSPVDVVVPVWYNNPFFYGTYPTWPNNFTEKEFDDMIASVDGRLYFAGDSLSKKVVGYLQAAYLTGEAAGLCISGVEKSSSQLKRNCPDDLKTSSTSNAMGSDFSVWGILILVTISAF